MKVVILAGGYGTRLGEETEIKPKPMVEIGGRPILWHIMKHYAYFGYNEFIVALGYKGAEIKKYFLDYSALKGNLTIHLANGQTTMEDKNGEDWIVHLIDTGLATQTGGRIKRLIPWLGSESFMVTYGDGVSDLNLTALTEFHKSHGTLATITAVRPPARFGEISMNGKLVTAFKEKAQTEEGWINGGFMIFEPDVLKYIHEDESSLEHDILETLAKEGKLAAYRHEGFWQCMDTPRDKHFLEDSWKSGKPPWKVWNERYTANKASKKLV